MQMIEAYNEGLKEFNKGDIFFAAKKFNEVELLYPQSIWAPRSTLWQHMHIILNYILMMQFMN